MPKQYHTKGTGEPRFDGPFTPEEIQRRIESGALPPDTLVVEASGQTASQLELATLWMPVTSILRADVKSQQAARMLDAMLGNKPLANMQQRHESGQALSGPSQRNPAPQAQDKDSCACISAAAILPHAIAKPRQATKLNMANTTRHRLKEKATIYSQQSAESPVVAELQAGDIVKTENDATSEDGKWDAIVLIDGRKGYISAKAKAEKLEIEPISPIMAGICLLTAGIAGPFLYFGWREDFIGVFGVILSSLALIGALFAFGRSRDLAKASAWLVLIFNGILLVKFLNKFGSLLSHFTSEDMLKFFWAGGGAGCLLAGFAIHRLRPKPE